MPNAEVGNEYRDLIANGEQQLSRDDPYARQVTDSIGNGVIHDPDFDWDGDAYTLSPWNELAIYELHIGTFNRPPARSFWPNSHRSLPAEHTDAPKGNCFLNSAGSTAARNEGSKLRSVFDEGASNLRWDDVDAEQHRGLHKGR